MRSCAYCGRENVDIAVVCRECGRTIEQGARLPPADVGDLRQVPERKLASKIGLATFLMWVCILASGGPLVYAVFRLTSVPSGPEGGFEGMAIVFTLFTWGVLLLFPLIGFMHALDWRRRLQDKLKSLQSEKTKEPA